MCVHRCARAHTHTIFFGKLQEHKIELKGFIDEENDKKKMKCIALKVRSIKDMYPKDKECQSNEFIFHKSKEFLKHEKQTLRLIFCCYLYLSSCHLYLRYFNATKNYC